MQGGNAVCVAAQTLITARHGAARVLGAWGGGGAGTAAHAKQQIGLLLEEYTFHLDPAEACSCLRSDSPRSRPLPPPTLCMTLMRAIHVLRMLLMHS